MLVFFFGISQRTHDRGFSLYLQQLGVGSVKRSYIWDWQILGSKKVVGDKRPNFLPLPIKRAFGVSCIIKANITLAFEKNKINNLYKKKHVSLW